MATVNPLTLSDADFGALGSPEELPVAQEVTKTQEQIDAEAETARLAQEESDRLAEEAGKEKPAGGEKELTEAEKLAQAEGEKEDDLTDAEKAEQTRLAALEAGKTEGQPNNKGSKEGTNAELGPDGKPLAVVPPVVTATTAAKEIDYKAAYEAVMKPFKANGKMIELKTPEELIQLAQMGANYTRKLQELQPSKKLLMMLENHDLLDEGKLSFLIDLSKKNPDAIKKLVKDSGLNPLEMDVEAESNYQAGNHRVDDETVNFKTALDDLRSQPKGQESLVLMNSTWDQSSKEVLWKQPALMKIMHQQIESGVYGLIEAEVDRKRVLGQIPIDAPFLDTYKQVGDELAKSGAFDNLANPGGSTTGTKTPIAKTTAAQTPVVKNGAQATAAAATRTSAKAVSKIVNPLAVSDDEFLKSMEQRL